MSEYVDQVRDAFLAQAAGVLEPARRLLRTDAVLNIPAFYPSPIREVSTAWLRSCSRWRVAAMTAGSYRRFSTRSAQAES
jgi:hypothetical protein